MLVEVLAHADIRSDEIAAIGITNQSETSIVWDRESGKPIYNTIVWQDPRTADYCNKLKKEDLEELYPAHHRPSDQPLLLRHQGEVDPRPCGRGA